VAARAAGRDDVAGVRAAALRHRRGQHRPQRAVEAVGVLALQAIDRHGGRDLGLPQDLVGQQVPDPGDLGLVEQAGLDRDRPLGDQGPELGRGDVKRVWPERVDIGVQLDAPEAALVEQGQAAAVGELEGEAVPLGLARLRVPAGRITALGHPAVPGGDHDAPAHAQVNAQDRTEIRVGVGDSGRLAPQGLAATVGRDEHAPGQRFAQLAGGQRPADERVGVVDADDAPA
jgi:hypothetical protein